MFSCFNEHYTHICKVEVSYKFLVETNTDLESSIVYWSIQNQGNTNLNLFLILAILFFLAIQHSLSRLVRPFRLVKVYLIQVQLHVITGQRPCWYMMTVMPDAVEESLTQAQTY